MGGTYSAIKFYQYGRKHFTQTGWKRAQSEYAADPVKNLDLSTVNLSNKVYAVTGANSGIGRCLTEYLAKQGAKVYMICRSEERGNKAKKEISDAIKLSDHDQDKLEVVIADMSLSEDVKAAIKKLQDDNVTLDGLVCNAGALLSKKQMTKEGLEVTFAAHMAVGTYLLTQLAIPLLEKSPDPRVVVVSSGGMYASKYPGWKASAKAEGVSFDGQLAYSYAKRAQVLLVERWAPQLSKIKLVACHPGWTTTPGVDAAYGSSQWFLKPLRSLWEGNTFFFFNHYLVFIHMISF